MSICILGGNCRFERWCRCVCLWGYSQTPFQWELRYEDVKIFKICFFEASVRYAKTNVTIYAIICQTHVLQGCVRIHKGLGSILYIKLSIYRRHSLFHWHFSNRHLWHQSRFRGTRVYRKKNKFFILAHMSVCACLAIFLTRIGALTLLTCRVSRWKEMKNMSTCYISAPSLGHVSFFVRINVVKCRFGYIECILQLRLMVWGMRKHHRCSLKERSCSTVSLQNLCTCLGPSTGQRDQRSDAAMNIYNESSQAARWQIVDNKTFIL